MKWRCIQVEKLVYWTHESDLHVFSVLMDSALVLVLCILKQTENNHCKNHLLTFSLNMDILISRLRILTTFSDMMKVPPTL